jgi:probable O-glycosylation ligase (exosortase A-associated)
MKMFLMTLVPLILLQEQNRLRLLLLVMTVSLGFFSVKAGIFSILTRGQHTVFGPDGTFISDNNSLALAELMILPVMVHLARTEPRPWVRRGLLVAVPLTLVSIIFSYSRGALVALVAVLGLHFATRKRWIYGAVFLVVAAGSMAFIPSKWFERMNTIKTYQSDPSAMGRINAWHFAFNVAQERPLTGGGFQVFTKALFLRYAPDPYDAHDAHSIYFEVLGEHGFVGLALFLLLLGSCLRSTGDVRKLARRNPSVGWAEDYATTLRLSLIAYAVGGTFLGMAYFDLYYNMVLAVLLLKVIVRKQLAAETAPPLVVVPQAAAVPA